VNLLIVALVLVVLTKLLNYRPRPRVIDLSDQRSVDMSRTTTSKTFVFAPWSKLVLPQQQPQELSAPDGHDPAGGQQPYSRVGIDHDTAMAALRAGTTPGVDRLDWAEKLMKRGQTPGIRQAGLTALTEELTPKPKSGREEQRS